MGSIAGVVTAVGIGLMANVALAGHTEPAQAKKAQFTLVRSYFPCSEPNTATSNGTPACAPAADASASPCNLSSTGSGKLMMKVTGSVDDGSQDIKLAAVAKGLNEFCEGLALCITLSFRAASDDCPEGSCTTVDVQDFEVGGPGCCAVADGKCKIKTTLLAGAPGIFANGKSTGIEVLGCGLKTALPIVGSPAMTCGVLLK